ncbi:uncharacterized protein BDR25DRAFT_327349 [Lindgomyces ingoldianus]|uniref:Uncharacterized protein n=1 Tax=Lindgomyces ingoldianus TaxID=673940 RepID=A0ACB6QMZ7_9PLEO|nr:uncharacterized protein BDR25DRAFT_327349 [Lindgomyces ingoldianus]KAF2467497.1 hypothetical protein BDR25DRAFT_327349 [Lindgomyces ingoldianus]
MGLMDRAVGGHKHHHIQLHDLRNELVSKLAPFSGLILTIILVIFFLIRYYLFETLLLPYFYPRTFALLNERNRRGFVNHHLAGAAKILLFIWTAYPFCAVAFGSATFNTPLHKGSFVTMGDAMLVASHIFVAMYLVELLYRSQLSIVAVFHHVGACVIAESAVAISLNSVREKDATIEFVLCFFWGAFDVIAEFWPHVTIILYRIYPTSHFFLSKIFRAAFFSTLCGTIIETIVVMWLFGSLWERWTIPFKVVTPMLHVVFSAAQVWGSWNFWKMWQREKKTLLGEGEKTEVIEKEEGRAAVTTSSSL